MKLVVRYLSLLAVAAAMTVAGRTAHAAPEETLGIFPLAQFAFDGTGPPVGNQATLEVRRQDMENGFWRWTYILDNKKDGVENPAGDLVTRDLHLFDLGINKSAAGSDWALHVTPYASFHDSGDPIFVVTPVKGAQTISWNWGVNGADFSTGKMTFQLDTDLQHVTTSFMTARDGVYGGNGAAPSPSKNPEPASMALLLSGVLPMALKLRRRGAATDEQS